MVTSIIIYCCSGFCGCGIAADDGFIGGGPDIMGRIPIGIIGGMGRMPGGIPGGIIPIGIRGGPNPAGGGTAVIFGGGAENGF